MRHRCLNPKMQVYKHYGGRGITICDRWSDVNAFVADMGPAPSAKHELDRIDVNGNYEPGNCRWATRTENVRNRRNTQKITAFGCTLPLVVWAEKYGIEVGTLEARLKMGFPAERALTAPVKKSGRAHTRLIEAFGQRFSLREWSRRTGLDRRTITDRLACGDTPEQALRPVSRNLITAFGRSMTIADWSMHAGIDRNIIRRRLLRGATLEQAISTPVAKRNRASRRSQT